MKAHLINDKDIRHLYQHAISSTANFTLLQPKFFSSLTVTNLSLSGLINKVNLTGLINTSMKLSGDQVVSGIVVRNTVKTVRDNYVFSMQASTVIMLPILGMLFFVVL